jgi:hypothetical protein
MWWPDLNEFAKKRADDVASAEVARRETVDEALPEGEAGDVDERVAAPSAQ